MDNFTKLCLFVIVISTSILAVQRMFSKEYIYVVKTGEEQRITICSATGDCGFGTHQNASLIIEDKAYGSHLFRVPDSAKYQSK